MQADHHVLEHGEVRHQPDVLKGPDYSDGGHPMGGPARVVDASESEGSGVDGLRPSDGVEDGCLSGPVRAGNPIDARTSDHEVEIGDGLQAAEANANASRLEQRSHRAKAGARLLTKLPARLRPTRSPPGWKTITATISAPLIKSAQPVRPSRNCGRSVRMAAPMYAPPQESKPPTIAAANELVTAPNPKSSGEMNARQWGVKSPLSAPRMADNSRINNLKHNK